MIRRRLIESKIIVILRLARNAAGLREIKSVARPNR
jgi:hypothetical protein